MGTAAEFTLPDPGHRLAGVRLLAEIGLPGGSTDFGYDASAGHWRLELDSPRVWRMEYRLELRNADGGTEMILDPAAGTAPGAFGPKSVRTLDGYAEPRWLTWPGQGLDARELALPVPGLGAVRVTVHSPVEPTDRLLVANDGPEFAALAGLVRYADAMIGGGRLPAFHLALLHPEDRNAWYSANPAYADALATVVLPALRGELGASRPVGMGASLGGLAMLHLHRRHPSAVRALFLQSGSFFVPEYDEQESGFGFYRRVIGFVRSVRDSRADLPRIPIAMTCGLAEENLACNRLMCSVLSGAGYPATLHEVPDAHNFVAWRDAFDPHLTALLDDTWR